MKDVINMPDGSSYFIVNESRSFFILQERKVTRGEVREVYDGFIVANVYGFKSNQNLDVAYAADYETARMIFKNGIGQQQLHKWKFFREYRKEEE